MIKAAFFGSDMIDEVYAMGRQARIAELADLYPERITDENLAEHLPHLSEVEAIFTTWGFPALNDEALAALSSLKIVLYAAGSVKVFAVPMLERGIAVVSARVPNGAAVARYTHSQICLACKDFFQNSRLYSRPGGSGEYRESRRGPGVFREAVAVLGMGAVGRQVAGRVNQDDMDVLAVDPTLSEREAEELNVRLVSLDEAFETAYVITNHMPSLESLKNVVGERQLRSMRENATFINTGRGAQVDEDAVIAVLRDRPDLTALLDVTAREPLEENSGLFELPNAVLTTHIAGVLGNELVLLADFVIDEFQRWQGGLPPTDPITLQDLPVIA